MIAVLQFTHARTHTHAHIKAGAPLCIKKISQLLDVVVVAAAAVVAVVVAADVVVVVVVVVHFYCY